MPTDPESIYASRVTEAGPMPKAPSISTPTVPPITSAQAPLTPQEVDSSGSPTLTPPPSDFFGTFKEPKKVFRAYDTPEGFSVSLFTDDGEETKMGISHLDNAREVLDQFPLNPITRSRDIPEEVATRLLKGDLPFPEYIERKWGRGKTQLAANLYGLKFLHGEIGKDETLSRADTELLKVQLDEAPMVAWNGGFKNTVKKMWDDLKEAGPVGVGRRMAGESAQLLPMMIDVSKNGMVSGLQWGASMAAAAMAAGPEAAPAAMAMFPAALEAGMTYGVFKRSFELESGDSAVDFLRKGFDPKDVRRVAPIAGAFKGVLEVSGFKFMTAPYRRLFAKKVIGSQVVKTAITKWYVNYLKEVGGEVTQETAQTLVDQVANNFLAMAEKDPKKLIGPVEGAVDLLNTALTTAAGIVPIQGASTAYEHVAGGEKKGKGENPKQIGQENPASGKPPVNEPSAPSTPEPKTPQQVDSTPQQLTAPLAEPATQSGYDAPIAAENAIAQGTLEKTGVVPTLPDNARTPEQVAEWANGQKWFHGSGVDNLTADTVSPNMTRIDGLLGHGLYITTDPEVAQTYADKRGRRSGTPTVYELGISVDRVLNAEQPAPSEVVDAMVRAMPDDIRGDIEVAAAKPDATLGQVWRAMGEALRDSELSVSDLAENFQELTASLREQGYDAIRYEGGKRTGNSAHEAMVLLDPNAEMTAGTKNGEPFNSADRRNIKSLDRQATAIARGTPEQAGAVMAAIEDVVTAIAQGTPEEASTAMTTLDNSMEPPPPPTGNPPTVFENPLESPDRYLDPIMVSEFDKFTPKPHFLLKSPMHAAIVLDTQVPLIQQGTVADQIVQESEKLAEAAAKSRERGLSDKLAPTLPEVFDAMNAPSEEARKAAIAKLTGPERAYFDFMWNFMRNYAKPFLESTAAMRSRFGDEKGYFPWVDKSAWEVLFKDDGDFLDKLKKLWDRARNLDDSMIPPNADKISDEAFFRHALFRSGKIDPSKNVHAVFSGYVRALSTKIALDQAVPELLNKVHAYKLRTDFADPDVERAHADLDKLLVQYVNALKGHSVLEDVIPKGKQIDTFIRNGIAYTSWLRIAFRAKLQALSLIGEVAGPLPSIGVQGLALGEWRLRTQREQSMAIIKKYESFVGESVVHALTAYGKTAGERMSTLPYALIALWSSHMKRVALLSQMTPAEFQTGEISPVRLAEIGADVGRWIPGFSNRSIMGNTSAAAATNQFHSWAIPTMFSAIEHLKAFTSFIKEGTPYTPLQKKEAVNVAAAGAIASVILFAATQGESEDDRKRWGPTKRKILSEMFTHLGALSPQLYASVAFPVWLAKQLKYLTQIAAIIPPVGAGLGISPKYSPQNRKMRGKFKGVEGIKRDNTPSFWNDLPISKVGKERARREKLAGRRR